MTASESEPLLIDLPAVLALVGMSRSHWLSLVSSGRAPAPVRVGSRKTMWRPYELREWVAAGCPSREKLERARPTAAAAPGRPQTKPVGLRVHQAAKTAPRA